MIHPHDWCSGFFPGSLWQVYAYTNDDFWRQQAISNTAYGIKAQSNPVTPEARGALLAEAEKLVEQGADAVILGCTEIPLALTEPDLRGVPLLDATKVLARALIIAFAPERLKKA